MAAKLGQFLFIQKKNQQQLKQAAKKSVCEEKKKKARNILCIWARSSEWEQPIGSNEMMTNVQKHTNTHIIM